MGTLGALPPAADDRLRHMEEGLRSLQDLAEERGDDFTQVQQTANLQGRVDDIVGRVDVLEAERPKNAFRLKPRDGHHHMETVRALDSGSNKGFGFELNFRGGIAASRDTGFNNRRINIDAIGGAGFCYDYFVDANWAAIVAAGEGTEGQSATTPTGHTFNIYSTIDGAISAANTLNTSGKMFSIGICPGTYVESSSWPNSAAGHTYSGLLIVGLGSSDDHRDFGQVYWSPSSGSAIELDAANPVSMQLENLVLDGAGSDPAIDWSAGSNLKGHAINCEFLGDVEMKTAGFWFLHCQFSGSGTEFKGGDTDDVFFSHCHFSGDGINLVGDTVTGLTVADCDFTDAAQIIIGRGSDIQIRGNTFSSSGADYDDAIVLDNTTDVGILHNVLIIGNTFEAAPTTTGQTIRLTGTASELFNVVIVGNTFSDVLGAVAATTAWIKATGDAGDKCFGLVIANNAFGTGTNQTATIEDGGGFTFIGDFVERSVFGPNTLIGKVKYSVTNGANNLYIPDSAATGGGPGAIAAADKIIDADGDTSVLVEKTADEDIIHFNVGGVVDVMTISDHGVDIHTTAASNDEHALEMEVDAAGFGDVKAIEIAYETGALATGEAAAIVLINIDELDATGGDIFGSLVLATEGGANEVFGLGVGVVVGPIHQDSGTFVNPTTGTNNTASTDVADMIDGSEGTNTTIFVADNDFIIIGAAAAFTSLECNIETPAAQPGIKPTFAYSTGSAFTTFSPIDGTNGFRNSGVVSWELDELTGHATNNDTGTFDIKITRTHAVAGSVSLFFAKTATTVVYLWDKDGLVKIKELRVGIEDTTAGVITAYGAATGSTQGGVLNLQMAADHDGSFNTWVVQVIEDDLKFETDTTDRMVLTVAGQLQLPITGSSAGLVIGGDALLYRDGANELRTPDALSVDGNITVGIADVAAGTMFLMGGGTGDDEGGEFQLHLADDHDGTFASWNFDVNQDDFRIFRSDAVVTNVFTAEGQLQLPTSGSGAGLLLGGDALLYRVSADVLRTPDSLIIDADLTISGVLTIPNGATPTVDAAGEIALDTTITDHTPLLRYYSGAEEMLVIAIPNDQLTAVDGHVIAYNAADNEFEMVAGGGGSGSMTTVKEGGFQLGGDDIVTLDFDGDDFNLTESPDTEVNITIPDASATVLGLVELATSAEVTTGTSTVLAMTPESFAESDYGIRYLALRVFALTETVGPVGDKKFTFHIPPGMDNWHLMYAHAELDTAGTTSILTIQLHNVDNALDMLTNKLTVDSGETGSDTAATAVSFNTSNDHVNTNDVIRGDLDIVRTGTDALGLLVTLGFQVGT